MISPRRSRISNINRSDLTAVAGDQAAIEDDEVNLPFVAGMTGIQLVPWTGAGGAVISTGGSGSAGGPVTGIAGPISPATITTSSTTVVTDAATQSAGGAQLDAVTTTTHSHGNKKKEHHNLQALAHKVVKKVKVVRAKETDRLKKR